jgi:Ribbon-helix-helix protein, copG family
LSGEAASSRHARALQNLGSGSLTHCRLTYVNKSTKVTYMEKTQIYLRKEELAALRKAAARSGRSVADLVRDAIRKVVLKPQSAGPVAIWDGEPKRTSLEHDSVHDQP